MRKPIFLDLEQLISKINLYFYNFLTQPENEDNMTTFTLKLGPPNMAIYAVLAFSIKQGS